MGRKKRLEDHELLAFARDVFVQDGFGASTRDIARRAGVSETVLFQRFRTKPELFFAAMVPPAPDLHAILAWREPDEEPSQRLEEVGIRVFAYFQAITPVLLPLISHPDFNYARLIERYPDSPLNQLVVGIRMWLGMLERGGTVTPGRADAMAVTLVSAMVGLAIFERMGVHGGQTDEQLVRTIARLIWRGGATAG